MSLVVKGPLLRADDSIPQYTFTGELPSLSLWGTGVVEGVLDQVPVSVFPFHTPYLSSIPDLKTRVLDWVIPPGAFASWFPLWALEEGTGGHAEPLGAQALCRTDEARLLSPDHTTLALEVGTTAVELTVFLFCFYFFNQ